MKKTKNINQLDHLKQICNKAGIKLTHQRLEIYKEIIAQKDHPSAELIHQRLQEKVPTMAIDTVYRTLATFEELGIVKKLNIHSAKTLFDANMDQHHHFVCTQCNLVEDIYWPEFDSSRLPDTLSAMGQIQSRHLELHGICKKCNSTVE